MGKKSYKKACRMRQKRMMEIIRSRKERMKNENNVTSAVSNESYVLHPLQNVTPSIIEENSDTLPRDIQNLQRSYKTYSNNMKKKPRKKKEQENRKKNVNLLTNEHLIENGGEERRIIDIYYFTNSLLNQISSHSPFECGAGGIEISKEKSLGLSSKITFLCKMCNTTFSVYTCDPKPKNTLDLNTATVSGMTVTGIGLAQLSELFAAMNLPQMSTTTYRKTDKNVSEKWEQIATEVMSAAAQREREAAIKEGKVKDGVAIIDVIADGCWGKRSYKKNYSALSGAAAIIGRRFGEILFLGVRNKYCSICAQAERKSVQPQQHTCYKNFTGPSTGMESDILVEGFKNSIDMHQIMYGRLIGDGDCNTYSKLLEARPYPNLTIEKLECKNHLLRNMCNKLAFLASDTKYPLSQRKLLTTQRILAVRKAICLAIQEISCSNEEISIKIKKLYKDITNTYNHAFGDHSKCETYYCSSKKTSENLVTKLRLTSFWNKIQFIVNVLASNSRSLVHNVSSNRVEGFNSLIAKLVGGKRTNLSARHAYQTRCKAAVVLFNTKKPIYTFQKKILGFSPKSKSKLLEERRIKKNKLCKNYTRRKILTKNQTTTADKNYGEECQKPDVSTEELTLLKDTFLKNLWKTEEQRNTIERTTVLQRDSGDWLELRRQLLTASNFGKIIKKRELTGPSLVKSMLYKKDISHVASIKHGVENESKALDQLSKQLNVSVQSCGLFIDPDIPYLGATPDGLIGDDQVVEIKCPISIFNLTSIKEAVLKKNYHFIK